MDSLSWENLGFSKLLQAFMFIEIKRLNERTLFGNQRFKNPVCLAAWF